MTLDTILITGRGVNTWKTVCITVFIALFIVAGCGGSGGSGTGNQNSGTDGTNPPGASDIFLSGTVLNNHTDESMSERAITDASVILVKAEDVERSYSVSPVEDLATVERGYPMVTTGSDGYYEFKTEDFSEAYPSNGNYFVFVSPPPEEIHLLPGGSASRVSISLDGATPVGHDIILTDSTGDDAEYIGSAFCLLCHYEKDDIKHSLHFVGLRSIGPNGTVTNDLMDMDDTSIYDLASNSDEMVDKFTNPPTLYTAADDPKKAFWLGRDDSGLYFQFISPPDRPKFYIKYTYGGETGLWRGLFLTTVYAESGTYAAEHGSDGDDYAYLVFAPFQYNEDADSIYGDTFVTFHADRWDFIGTGNNGFTADPELDSFDIGCAGCHGATRIRTVNRGLATERKVAVYPEYFNGYLMDGVKSEINIGCEKCHGPGSNHIYAGEYGRRIVSPGMLPPGRLTMICGSCHTGGENYTDMGGGVPVVTDAEGNYETFRPGMSPVRFFGTLGGTGNDIVPFGTFEQNSLSGQGYLEPADFETDTATSWMDMQFGAVVNHSKASQQQYQDFVRSEKYRNNRVILTCISCHDAHGSSHRHMVTDNVENNAVCLPCHSGAGRLFPNLDSGMMDRLENGTSTTADATAIGEDVEAHILEKTGSLQMAPYDPDGTGMGRCTLCHMPKTARSADWHDALETGTRQYRHGDISSHAFDVMPTEAENDMADARGAINATPAGITDECGDCHGFAGLK